MELLLRLGERDMLALLQWQRVPLHSVSRNKQESPVLFVSVLNIHAEVVENPVFTVAG